jgi:hypothetical protein
MPPKAATAGVRRRGREGPIPEVVSHHYANIRPTDKHTLA